MRILIWILMFYLLYRLFKNIFAPMARVVNKPDMSSGGGKNPGEVEITDLPEEYKNHRKKDNSGEYIDYKDV